MTELINSKNSFAAKIIRFYLNLEPHFSLPPDVEILQPYCRTEVQEVLKNYYQRFYKGNQRRVYLVGINPGRFGGGITGIPFTDPVRLKSLGIKHSFDLKPELSSDFVYRFIDAYGGMEKFADKFFLTAISPIGFTRNGKNFNYYDDRQLEANARPWMIKTMHDQVNTGADKQVAICLGEGTNFKYLSALNKQEGWFSEIISLPHPRWVMQYRRKMLDHFIEVYIRTLNELKQYEK